MKILHLLYESSGDYFGIGGVGIRAYDTYKYLKDRHDITLLCKRYPGAIDGEVNGLRHIFVGTESRSLTKTLLSYAYHASRFVKAYGSDYDIIIEDFSPAIPTFLHAFTQKPIVLQIQGYTGSHYFRKYNPAHALTLFSLEKLRPLFYKNFIFISKETLKRVLGYFSPEHDTGDGPFISKGDKFFGIIPNGINQELLNVIPEEDAYILYLGRIDIYGKGLDILLKAYREFFRSFPDTRLFIAGDGRDRKRFEGMLMGLPADVRNNIELKGWVTGDKKTEIIRKALFCVFPSRHEVQPISAIEVMACGKAVIVSDIPGFGYVVKKGAGISFMTGDASSLSRTMRNLMIGNERKEMGQRGRDLVKNFTWDKIASRFEGFLYRVLERQGM